jgi:hypothetical protein
MGRKTVTQSKGAFGWNTTAYANFKTWQKVIFWLWPVAILNYLFIAYWFMVFLGNRKKPLEERRETYIRALYYFNIFWFCAIAIVVTVLLLAPDPNDRCPGFYCESTVPYANDNRCENPAHVLGDDGLCHAPCGSPDAYCGEENSYCFRNDCVSCPAETALYNDGNCYE